MVLTSVGWLMLYRAHPGAPSPLGTHPSDGWWGWFDQGQYLKITSQFAAGDWFNPDKYYPPLYPAIPASLSKVLGSNEAYILTDLTLSLAFFSGLFINFRAYLNPLLSLGSIILMYGITRIAYEQWVIPWTTNLSSTILIAISLLSSWEYYRTSFHLSWINWRASAAALLTAMLIWVRPFEIIPAAVLCFGLLTFQIKGALITSQPTTPSQTARRLAKIVSLPIVAFASTLTIYALYNIQTFSSWEPSYSKTINSMGFSPWDLGFKFISLATDSSVYGLNNGHLSYALPLFIPLAVLSIISILFLALPQKTLVIAAFTSFISYLSFNDLVPTGLFTFNNIHYFTWSLAIFAVSAIAALKAILQASINQPGFRRQQLPILACCWTIASITLMHLQPQTNAIRLRTSAPTIICPAERTNTSGIRNKAAQFQFYTRQASTHKRIIGQTRLLKLNVETSSDPTQIHLAHQDQIDLSLNGKKLLYRKDWRLVSRKEKGENKLSVLLHQPIDKYPVDGLLRIGQKSNVELANVNFATHRCNNSVHAYIGN